MNSVKEGMNGKLSILSKLESYKLAHKEHSTFCDNIIAAIDLYAQQRTTLLTVSDAITKVRNKTDLITVISSTLKEMFSFTHALISLIDQTDSTYGYFCADPCYTAVKDHHRYKELLGTRFNLDEPFIQSIINSSVPVSYHLEQIKDVAGVPAFIKVNYESGTEEILMVALRTKMETIGFLHIYSNDSGCFTPEFRSLIMGIAPQLSNAVLNILLNEELSKKEHINEFLISLSNELVSVRHKKDLLKVLNKGLKKAFNFSHSAIVLANDNPGFYSLFLSDQDSEQRNLNKFNEALTRENRVDDSIFNVALKADKPVIFDSNSVELKASPLWYRFNYASGTRETLIKVFRNSDSPEFALMLFADKQGTFDAKAIDIIERTSDQLSSITKNIAANEQLRNRDEEKSFLLQFSTEIATVRKKEDLLPAIRKTMKKLSPVKIYGITKINADGRTMSIYAYDKNPKDTNSESAIEIGTSKFPIEDNIQNQVLASSSPIVFNIDEEIQHGNSPEYLLFWKNMGFEKIVGMALRTGSEELGIFWFDMNEINTLLIKGICSQISISMSNLMANEQVLKYQQRLEIENDHLHEQIKTYYNFTEIIGNGAEMQKIYDLMNIVASSDSTVLVLGETGTGKELIARAIHNSSPRQTKLMVKVNCAALPESLIESELFGHEKGSFTGAYERRIGKFELADGGTIFLDEIGEMPLELQAKLLRVIQEREFERIGGKTTIRVNVRIIAATNRDLQKEVTEGRFRSDLFYRLNVFPINLPPLRARLEDMEPLAVFFVHRYSKLNGLQVDSISGEVLQKLREYTWPGNIRELEHLIERSILFAEGSILSEIDLPINMEKTMPIQWPVSYNALHDVERAHILEALKRCNGKVSGNEGAAELLGIPASTLHSKMKKLSVAKLHYANNF